jgi:hypothetical protein
MKFQIELAPQYDLGKIVDKLRKIPVREWKTIFGEDPPIRKYSHTTDFGITFSVRQSRDGALCYTPASISMYSPSMSLVGQISDDNETINNLYKKIEDRIYRTQTKDDTQSLEDLEAWLNE